MNGLAAGVGAGNAPRSPQVPFVHGGGGVNGRVGVNGTGHGTGHSNGNGSRPASRAARGASHASVGEPA